jgi:hypothetical protein
MLLQGPGSRQGARCKNAFTVRFTLQGATAPLQLLEGADVGDLQDPGPEGPPTHEGTCLAVPLRPRRVLRGAPSPLMTIPLAGQPRGGVSDLDIVIRNPADSQHVKATYIHIWNTT